MTGDRTPLRERLVETLIAHARRGTHEKEIKLSAFMEAVIRTGAESRADAVLPVVEDETAALRATIERIRELTEQPYGAVYDLAADIRAEIAQPKET